MALLLAVPTWAGSHGDGRKLDEADAAAAILRAAGWRAVTVSAETPLRVAWERLHNSADQPSRGSAGWFPAGTPQ
jgi:type II secretory pathway pseudopilin PulG